MQRQTRYLILCFTIGSVLIASCSTSSNKAIESLTSKKENESSSTSNVEVTTDTFYNNGQTGITDPKKIYYSYAQKTAIMKRAKEIGLLEIYLPQVGNTDYLMEIRKTDRYIDLVYPHFDVKESNIDMKTLLNNTQQLNLNNETTAIYTEQELKLKIGSTNVIISSAKVTSGKELINVAESLEKTKTAE